MLCGGEIERIEYEIKNIRGKNTKENDVIFKLFGFREKEENERKSVSNENECDFVAKSSLHTFQA